MSEPRDLHFPTTLNDDADIAARVQASYASLPVADAAQVAHVTRAVLASAAASPTVAGTRMVRPRWWWGAAAAAVLVVVVMRPWRPEASQQAADSAFVATPGAAVPSGAISEEQNGAMRFTLTLPSTANAVSLVGDFNGWDERATPMVRRGPDGSWSAQVPLAPGRHTYAFVVDGQQWLVDPLAPQVPDAGFGPTNTVIVDGAHDLTNAQPSPSGARP